MTTRCSLSVEPNTSSIHVPITLSQKEYVEQLSPHDLQPDDELRSLKDQDVVSSPRWLKRFRGANGALQWLCTNTRPGLAADTSIRAGTFGIGATRQSLSHAQKIIRKAHARIDVDITIKHINPEDIICCAFMMLVGRVDQTGVLKEGT